MVPTFNISSLAQLLIVNNNMYSLAGFEMILTRHVSHYIITYYLPSGLFVVVSWISFLVPPDVIPGKKKMLYAEYCKDCMAQNGIQKKLEFWRHL